MLLPKRRNFNMAALVVIGIHGLKSMRIRLLLHGKVMEQMALLLHLILLQTALPLRKTMNWNMIQIAEGIIPSFSSMRIHIS